MQLLVKAAVLAVLLSAACVSAVERRHGHSHSHHHHHRHEQGASDDIPPPPAGFPPPFLPGSAGDPSDAFRFLQTELSGTDPSNSDIIKSVYNLLYSQRDANLAETTQVLQRKAEAEKEEQNLQERSRVLRERAEMLTRLQFCLEQDATSRAANSSRTPQQQQQAGRPTGAMSSQQSAVLDERLRARQQELDKMAADIKARQQQLDSREQLLNTRDAAVRKRIDEARALEARIALRQNDANVAKEEPKGAVRQGTAAQPVPAAAAAAGQRSSPTAAALRQRVLQLRARRAVCPGSCSSASNCNQCTLNPRCGWCSTTNSCQPVVRGAPANCTAQAFSYLFCKSNTCGQHVNCRSCLADQRCGRCMSTNKCALGNAAGPSSGECRDWCYAVPLKVLSMNVYGRDLTNVTSRATRLMQIIRAENADFVLLQEVEDWFLQALQQQPFARSYHASDFGSGHAPGGLLILSKVPLSSVAYYEKTMPGQVEVDQRGRVLVVTPRIGRGNLAVATTTLDWRSGENRASSLDYIFSVLAPAQNVVLGGDFNFDFGAQPETSRLPSRYLDVWRVLRPRQPGFTWDPINNSYARNSDPNSRQSRIDRVFVSSSFTRLLDVQKIGASDVSPHYGLSVRVRMFGAYC